MIRVVGECKGSAGKLYHTCHMALTPILIHDDSQLFCYPMCKSTAIRSKLSGKLSHLFDTPQLVLAILLYSTHLVIELGTSMFVTLERSSFGVH